MHEKTQRRNLVQSIDHGIPQRERWALPSYTPSAYSLAAPIKSSNPAGCTNILRFMSFLPNYLYSFDSS